MADLEYTVLGGQIPEVDTGKEIYPPDIRKKPVMDKVYGDPMGQMQLQVQSQLPPPDDDHDERRRFRNMHSDFVPTAVAVVPSHGEDMAHLMYGLMALMDKYGDKFYETFGADMQAPGFVKNGLVLPEDVKKGFPLEHVGKIKHSVDFSHSACCEMTCLLPDCNANAALRLAGMEGIPGLYTLNTSIEDLHGKAFPIVSRTVPLDAYKIAAALRDEGYKVDTKIMEFGRHVEDKFYLSMSMERPELASVHRIMLEIVQHPERYREHGSIKELRSIASQSYEDGLVDKYFVDGKFTDKYQVLDKNKYESVLPSRETSQDVPSVDISEYLKKFHDDMIYNHHR